QRVLDRLAQRVKPARDSRAGLIERVRVTLEEGVAILLGDRGHVPLDGATRVGCPVVRLVEQVGVDVQRTDAPAELARAPLALLERDHAALRPGLESRIR